MGEFSRRFEGLHLARCKLARNSNASDLYRAVGTTGTLWPASPAILLVRSAAAVEQMINGITVRLWDDPFEWTLPEWLPTKDDLIAYFEEVERARARGFQFIKDDSDLERSIPAPRELRSLERIFSDTLDRSEDLFSKANFVLQNK